MQLDLLTDTPRARKTDPATSHQAAARIKASGALGEQQQMTRDLVQRFPGLTSAELAQELAREWLREPTSWPEFRPMIARRLPEISPVHARKGEARPCAVTGANCVTWWPI